MNRQHRSPGVAAVLNVIIPGTGYLYAGRRDAFSWLIVTSTVLYVVGLIIVFERAVLRLDGWESLSGFAIAIALGVDAFATARKQKAAG